MKEQDGAQDDDEVDVLSPEDMQRILCVVSQPHSINPVMLEIAAGIYCDIKKRGKNSAGRGLRKDLTIIARKCRELSDNLSNLPIDMEILLIASMHLFPSKRSNHANPSNKAIADMLLSLADSVDRFLAKSKGRLEGFDPTVKLTLSTLAIAYMHGTSRKITHSSHKDGEHLGEPRSEFGRLVAAFFNKVDPELTKVSLTTMVRNFVREHNRQSVGITP